MGVMGKLLSLGVVLLSLVSLFFLGDFSGRVPDHTSVLTQLDSVFGVPDTEYPHHHRNHHRHHHLHAAQPRILQRADSTCGPDRPCENGACCGPNGYCGFGDDYCGDGCVSNCDATAECGKNAKPADKLCPLNTCCSEFGFCGTTEVGEIHRLYPACRID